MQTILLWAANHHIAQLIAGEKSESQAKKKIYPKSFGLSAGSDEVRERHQHLCSLKSNGYKQEDWQHDMR
ncbi:hypothetical protein CQP30_04560 [Yersinia pestis]|uniref:Uncharacterized protein n=4 Tax=Yersinia pseudotuberculosis complex TaxID=1649845 RepID=A0AAP0VRL3_YERPE|nr:MULTISPECIES: hypothetical protein [Yersinia pseudotuberculosis complex]ERP77500.1 hypothetical protein L327_03270 [Yersinia pestis S3]ERP77624.1 hypothetical protein L328_03290 [Yersinia pestis 24H]AAM87048.1 hypothetical [Yersinia pestis KIM10+]AAS63170.1 hypothetical protein YP_2992 [Yersinia pestis biovar Microtus str. 91001]ABP38874.1 hypothetical protein YPDSF_0461 [Yersinia pestis Pestoides F]